MLLHLHLIHFSNRYILNARKKGIDLGLTLSDGLTEMDTDYFCKGCQVRHRKLNMKETRQNFSHYKPLEFVCMDGTGPLPIDSIHGNKYIWGIMCLATRWTVLFFTKTKDQATVFVVFQNFLDYVNKKTSVNVESVFATRKLLTDLGGEFCNKSMENLCSKRRINHQTAIR